MQRQWTEPSNLSSTIIRTVALICIFIMIQSHGVMAASQPTHNVVLITVNVLRPDHLGCYGYGYPTAPNIDQVAAEACLFTNAFTHSGYTLPSMMSMMTSLFPDSHQVYEAFKDELSIRVKTLAQVLSKNGYRTGWFSMLDEPHLNVEIGFGRGFDYLGELGRNFEGLNELLDWLRVGSKNPFFMALNTRHMHTPYLPLPEFRQSFKRGSKGRIIDNLNELNEATYFEMLELINKPGQILHGIFSEKLLKKHAELFNGDYRPGKLDAIENLAPIEKLPLFHETYVRAYNKRLTDLDKENLEYLHSLYDSCLLGVDQVLVGSIIKVLKETGQYENTILIITGDHGEAFGEHGPFGHGFFYYDEVIRVPLIIKAPFVAPKKLDVLAQSIDIMPTILELLDLPNPPQVQGRSLVAALEAKPGQEPEINEYVAGQVKPMVYLRTKKYKYIAKRRGHQILLDRKVFDLEQDPGETIDVSNRNPKKTIELHRQIMANLSELTIYKDKEYYFPDYMDEATRKRIRETGYW